MKMKSVIQEDLSKCFISGSNNVAIHHIFPGNGRRKKCEEYGYIVALEPIYHTLSKDSVHMSPNKGIDLSLKAMAQEHFEKNNGSRTDFIKEFGRSWL